MVVAARLDDAGHELESRAYTLNEKDSSDRARHLAHSAQAAVVVVVAAVVEQSGLVRPALHPIC